MRIRVLYTAHGVV
jgi:hypothetical protein